MLRLFVAVLAALLLTAPAATAAPPDLSSHGIEITWPKNTIVLANAPLTVKVRSAREPVSLKLTRVTKTGKVMRVLARKRVRNGSLRVTLPPAAYVSYRLTVRAVGRTWTETFRTLCGKGGVKQFQATVTPNVARSGESVRLQMHNPGTACIEGGVPYGWERPTADGGWQTVPLPPSSAWPMPLWRISPGSYRMQVVDVWPTEPGPYRLVKTFGGMRVALPFTIAP